MKTGQLKITQFKEQKDKTMKKNEQNFRDLGDTTKHTKICTMMHLPQKAKGNSKEQKDIWNQRIFGPKHLKAKKKKKKTLPSRLLRGPHLDTSQTTEKATLPSLKHWESSTNSTQEAQWD